MDQRNGSTCDDISNVIPFDRLKHWRSCFFEDREAGDHPLSEVTEEYAKEGDSIEFFLQPEEGTCPPERLDAARRFLYAAQTGAKPPLSERRAYVLSRQDKNTDKSVEHSHLNHEELSCVLRGLNARLDGTKRTGFDQVLINLCNLDPDFARAIILNVTDKRADALRCAFLGHVIRIAALQITIPVKGHTTFCLEFHLPYLTMAHDEVVSGPPTEENSSQAEGPAFDLSFLEAKTNPTNNRSFVFNAHASIVIHGTDHFKYIGYSFVFHGSIPPNQGLLQGEDDTTQADNEAGEDETTIEPMIDHFVTHGCAPTLLASDSPQDPRQLFLKAVHHRCSIIVEAYSHVVAQVEKKVKTWIAHQFDPQLTNTSHSGQNSVISCPYETLQRAGQMTQDIRVRIAAAICVWTNFERRHGDMAYFRDIEDITALQNLDRVRGFFEDLKSLDSKLALLERSCERWAKILEYRAAVRGNEISRHNGLTNQEASETTRDAARVAATSLEVAKKTTKISHISIYFAFVTTPFIIVLQYFTSDQKIFAFERTPRTFFISVTILLPLLLSLALVLYGIDVSKERMFWKLYEVCGGTRAAARKKTVKNSQTDGGTEQLHP